MVTSLLAGTVGINVGIAGAPKRLATLLNRHNALYESGAKGTVFKRESADHRSVESSVRLYVLPDGTAVFRPSHDNEGTPEAAAARRARSDADAARLNQTISAAANAMTAKQAAIDAGYAPDDTPATLKFSKHTLLAIDAGGNRSVGRDAPPIGIRAGVDTAAIGWGLGLSRHGACPDGSYHIQTQFSMQGLLHLRVYSLSSTP